MITDILLTIITMAFAIMVVFSKKTVVAALSLLMTLIMVGIIYFQLGTAFLALVQILVNAGAVAILFVFVMMLINLDRFENNRERSKFKLGVTAATILVILGVFSLIISGNLDTLTEVNIMDNSMNILFEKLFMNYYLPFELVSVLLLGALVACIVITSHKQEEKRVEKINE